MIIALDHPSVAVRDIAAAADAYRRLLGREPEFQDGAGARRAWFHLGDTSLEVIAPTGEGPSGDRLREVLDTEGEGMWLTAFAVDDLDAAERLLNRRGFACERVGAARPVLLGRAAGLRMAFVEPRPATPSAAVGDEAATVTGLDHFVIQTPDPERAVANLAGRLGLDLRLDRDNPRFGVRQLWFRVGETVIEVASRIGAPAGEGPDRFGGLAWRVTDPEAVHARLSAEGFDVSELRAGRKPGTRVFTVRDAPAGVPTLVIQQNAEAA